jgi:Spy/CpxP family protein refolding chaperone
MKTIETGLDSWLSQAHEQLRSTPQALSIEDLLPEQREQLEEIKLEIAKHLSEVILSTQKTIHALTKKEKLIQSFLLSAH